MTDRPNILLLFPDQWRWDYLGCEDSPYGKVPVRTPNIDRLAARGVHFLQCRTNSPVCSPARACLALGVRYDRCGCPSNAHYTPSDRETMFARLRQAGYHTATCGKSDLFKPNRLPTRSGYLPIMDTYGFSDGIDHRGKGDAINLARAGIDEPYTVMLRERGLLDTHLADHPENSLGRAAYPTPLPNDAYTDDFCAANALKLLDRTPDDTPWCLWVNFPGPHNPFDPPADALEIYADVEFPPPVNPADNPPSRRDAREDRRHYAASCTNIDRLIGRLLQQIEKRGELDNTLIVFSSDHGEMLGDHGRWAKSVPQEGSVHVPLIVAGPGVQAGGISDALAETVDLSTTVLEAAGLAPLDDTDGRSLWPVLSGREANADLRDVQISALGKWQMAFDGRYKLVRTEGEPDRLYDLREDPAELTDVSGEHADELARLGAAL